MAKVSHRRSVSDFGSIRSSRCPICGRSFSGFYVYLPSHLKNGLKGTKKNREESLSDHCGGSFTEPVYD